MRKKETISEDWLQEITIETEHYFQGEMQQEQRASWLLATTSALIALLIGLQLSAIEKNISLPSVWLAISVGSFLISSTISILVILPLRGIHSFWGDLFGKNYRANKNMKIDEIIKKRFRHDNKWSRESLDERIKQHFRSHFLRNSKKAYGIVWASMFLLIGLGASTVLVISFSIL